MSEAQKILDMIEEVDPSDSNALTKIDGYVFCYLNEYDPEKIVPSAISYPMWKDPLCLSTQYTRSRDALKAIRPEGWIFLTDCIDLDELPEGYTQRYTAHKDGGEHAKEWAATVGGKFLPTEELAELHAIIQAIDYERKNNDEE